MPRIVPEDKARQGRWGWHTFRILIAALLLAFIAWGIAEIYGNMIDKRSTTEQGELPRDQQGEIPKG